MSPSNPSADYKTMIFTTIKLHGVEDITKLYFAIFAAFKESMTLNLTQRSSKAIILVPIESAYTYSYLFNIEVVQ